MTNTGEVEGTDTVLLFVSAPGAGVNGVPIKSLKGFEKVRLAPGEAQTVTMDLGSAGLRNPDEDGAWQVPSGTYTVAIGVGANEAKTTLEVA